MKEVVAPRRTRVGRERARSALSIAARRADTRLPFTADAPRNRRVTAASSRQLHWYTLWCDSTLPKFSFSGLGLALLAAARNPHAVDEPEQREHGEHPAVHEELVEELAEVNFRLVAVGSGGVRDRSSGSGSG